jgi:Mu-like prophage I protein
MAHPAQIIERGFFKSARIRLGEQPSGMPATDNPVVQILRVGKFNHPKYGEFEITPMILAEMKSNFDNDIRGVDIAFDYFHDSDKVASGWPTDLYLLADGNELWAKVDWTPTAKRMLAERELRYFSPDFAFKWTDPETQVTYKNVLFGGGLTNRPFVKDMAAIVASETNEENEMTPEELKRFEKLEAAILKLSEAAVKPPVAPPAAAAPAAPTAEDHAALKASHDKLAADNAAMKKKLDDAAGSADDGADDSEDDSADPAEDEESDDPKVLKAQLAKAKEANAKLMAEKKSAEDAKLMAEKEQKFSVMLSEGKACAAQKKAFMKGDMEEFVKLSEPVNLKTRGTSSSGDGSGDKDEDILKLAEAKMKADPKLNKLDAITLAQREIK